MSFQKEMFPAEKSMSSAPRSLMAMGAGNWSVCAPLINSLSASLQLVLKGSTSSTRASVSPSYTSYELRRKTQE